MASGYSRSRGRFGEALLHRADVDCSEVTVTVREGEVTLEGSVPQRSMRYLIEDLAAGHPAVREVTNQIEIRKLRDPRP
jgi:osmotically-inducible protein OsmY